MDYRFLLILLLLISLALNFQPVANSHLVKFIRLTTTTAFYPIQVGFNFVGSSVPKTFYFFFDAYNYRQKSEQLSQELKQVKSEVVILESIKQENKELKKALGFNNSFFYSFDLIPAQIVGKDKKNWSFYALVNAGFDKGVKPGFSVISDQGLVGLVVEVNEFSSKILIIVSPENFISVMSSKSGVHGVARGDSVKKLIISYIPEDVSVEVNEKFVVSSSSSIFIPGMPVGVVSKIEKNFDNIFQKIELSPCVDFSKLKMVFICKR